MVQIISEQYLEKTIARLKDVRAELKAERDSIYGRARANLAPHDNPGGCKVTKTSGAVDYFVNLDDGDGVPAAAAIEFGWTTKNGKPVEGLHILGRAAS